MITKNTGTPLQGDSSKRIKHRLDPFQALEMRLKQQQIAADAQLNKEI